MKSLGKHLIVELYHCDAYRINQVEEVERILVEAVNISKATIVQPVFHQFSPHGVSGVVVIAESHFSIHTWPEFGYCALDIFTCGDQIDSDASLRYIKKELQAESLFVTEMRRGMLDIPTERLRHKP
ncbi:adenosylmethionine decarboxylase [Desulfoglaeba alkanexedens]|jgi:S-adenosylmethionine decarboxylase|uniref:S-adenosylmethionine decarboxylase proenzyme n=1 Tax=Desulfoglaeba alkanexedens ALDC TaxID=980445 RepID=A0A4P8L914_9BACT|nr:adenosylmethionine decarboxylase [Desulfoglaeba alkanexedens]QCQ23132.1 S-adenosylmethionine decarboxylase proenzyme [Desulfoglaeba alkanexedens ALDC]